jgi:hypothetical protein
MAAKAQGRKTLQSTTPRHLGGTVGMGRKEGYVMRSGNAKI